jgi:hypothetical protein
MNFTNTLRIVLSVYKSSVYIIYHMNRSFCIETLVLCTTGVVCVDITICTHSPERLSVKPCSQVNHYASGIGSTSNTDRTDSFK